MHKDPKGQAIFLFGINHGIQLYSICVTNTESGKFD
jgi:hypothetical protein